MSFTDGYGHVTYGWTCSSCGAWVTSGQYHLCPNQQITYYYPSLWAYPVTCGVCGAQFYLGTGHVCPTEARLKQIEERLKALESREHFDADTLDKIYTMLRRAGFENPWRHPERWEDPVL